MELNQPYYIDKHENSISLGGEWNFCFEDVETDDISSLKFKHKTAIPSSIYHSLYHAGILPDPYYGTNSKQYHWVDEKIWYYKKSFSLDSPGFEGNAFLCFEGVAYYSRVWLNGTLLGDHEGMYGGPVVDAAKYLDFNGENELVVEVKACNFGQKEGYYQRFYDGKLREIVPWNIIKDNSSSNGDFIVIGIWNDVRLELLPKIHMSRPYMYTHSVSENKAQIHFEARISSEDVKELEIFKSKRHIDITYAQGITGALLDSSVQISIKLKHGDRIVYESTDDVPLTDFEHLGMDKRFHELQFYQKDFEINNPQLWWPNGMGEAFLYDAEVTLLCDEIILDTHHFKFGVRKFDADYTKGQKYREGWEKFLFSINGKQFFLKGMNWTPIDFLYDISPDRYEWCLTLAKNAGIQLIRVWNGGGMPETDAFYEICDRLGILVWQDILLANTINGVSYPLDIFDWQISYNLYRIRNHASLVILCGGNEFNPYLPGNASAMFITQKTVKNLCPDRIFHYTTPDKGSAHVYNDMEPTWYRHRYSSLPFLAESGIHSFPNFKSIKKLISEKEANSCLPDLSFPEFSENFPELLNHFSEYRPNRIPRMTSRISQIINMKNITLEDICEASHVQTYEFYQLMIQSMQEHYPYCGGIMPWVFKRPWTTSAIQTVDGDDRPCLSYYSVQNAYRPISIIWRQEWSIIAPLERMSLKIRAINDSNKDLSSASVKLTVYNPDLSKNSEYSTKYEEDVDFGYFTPDESFINKCFLVCADIETDGNSIARSVYFCKCTSMLSDRELYEKHRSAPTENLRFDSGPWLKNDISCAKKQSSRLSAQTKEQMANTDLSMYL